MTFAIAGITLEFLRKCAFRSCAAEGYVNNGNASPGDYSEASPLVTVIGLQPGADEHARLVIVGGSVNF